MAGNVIPSPDAVAFADRIGELLTAIRSAEAELGALLVEIEQRGVMELFGYRSAARLLEHLADEPKPTSERLMKRARLVNPGRNLDGSRIPALAPATGVAARAGRLSNPMIDVITDVLNQVPPEHRLSAETNLLTFAEQAGHKQVAALGTRILAHLVPDGPAPDDTEPVAPSRELFLRRSSTGAENPGATTSTHHCHLQPEHGKGPQPHGYGPTPTRSPQATHQPQRLIGQAAHGRYRP